MRDKSLDMVKLQRQKIQVLNAHIRRNDVKNIIQNERPINMIL